MLHVSSGLGLGGAERSLLQLVQASDSAAVAALTSAADLVPEFPQSPWRFDMRSHPLATLRALCARAREFQPDLIQGWMYHGNLVASVVGSRLDLPVIWSVRHSLEQYAQEAIGLRAVIQLGRLRAFRCDRVVYNSAIGWRTHARRGYGSRPSMIIPNGVDTERFRPRGLAAAADARAQLLATTDTTLAQRPLCAAVMRYHPMKGVSVLLDAWASLHRRDAQTAPLLALIGSGMIRENSELAAAIASRGLADAVICCGPRHDLDVLYAGFDAVVLPSLFGEGTPNVLLEAQACGAPVVATRVGDAERVVAEPEALVPPGDAAALAAAVMRELSRPAAQRRAQAEANRERVATAFSLERCHARYFVLHAELAGGESSRHASAATRWNA